MKKPSLDQRLQRFGKPPLKEIESAAERVWRNVSSQAVVKPLPESLQWPSQETVEKVSGSRRPATVWRLSLVAAAAVLFAVFVAVFRQEVPVPVGGIIRKEVPVPTTDVGEITKSLHPSVEKPEQVFRSAGKTSTTITLTDGSKVEMQAGTEGVVEQVVDGLRIHLKTGSIIVQAAKQAEGRHLYVQTRDVTVSVVGTTFLVKTNDRGSHVVVIEGEVRVQHGIEEKKLLPGEKMSSSSKLDDLEFFKEIGWSREAAAYLSMLHESMKQGLVTRQAPARGATTSEKPRFEEASIRRCEQEFQAPAGARGGGSGSIRYSPGRVDALCLTVATLIQRAYRSPLRNNGGGGARGPRMNATASVGEEDGTRVRGRPDWVRSEKYTIAAVGDASADTLTLQDMLMDLLQRRFQLQLRIDAEEIPAYALTIHKDGLQLKPAEPGTCGEPAAGAGPGTPRIVNADQEGQTLSALRRGGPPPCGETGHLTGPNLMYVGGRVRLASIANALSGKAGIAAVLPALNGLNGLLVLDRTNLPETQLFNYVLEFEADPKAAEVLGASLDEPGVPRAPTVFEALERLGLKLESIKDTREYVVIDHIDRPSPN